MEVQLYGASGELQKIIAVEKFVDRFGTGVDYHIDNRLRGVRGLVEVRYRNLQWYEGVNSNHVPDAVVEALVEEIDDDEAVVAEIQRFFPHGEKECIRERVPRDWQRRGIGTSILRTVLQDLDSEEIPFVYTCTHEPFYYNSLLKSGFRDLRPEGALSWSSEDHLLRSSA
jgi:hypothetical protein